MATYQYVDTARSNALVTSTLSGYGTIPNVVNTAVYSNVKIPALIVRTQKDSTYAAHEYTGHIRGFMEPNAGAHYYIESEYGTRYQKMSCIVDLSKVKVYTKNNKRHAFISFTMVTEGNKLHMADIGLANFTGSASDWFITSHAPTVSTSEEFVMASGSYGYGEGKKIPTNTKVKMEYFVERTSTKDRVTGRFLDASTNQEFAKIVYEGNVGDLFISGTTTPRWRCKRFMSLVPIYNTVPANPDAAALDGFDVADGTYLEATMEDLRLYTSATATSGTVWGDGTGSNSLNKGDVCYAWLVQTNNIPAVNLMMFSGSGTSLTCKDYISIKHATETHR